MASSPKDKRPAPSSDTAATGTTTSSSLLKQSTKTALLPALGVAFLGTAAAYILVDGTVERILVSALVVCASLTSLAYKDTLQQALRLKSIETSLPQQETSFKSFQSRFLVVQLVATFVDFIQGPYLYKVYEGYGFDMNDIAFLYLIGFGSTALTSPVAGLLADTYGRRAGCMAFAALQATSCLMLHQPTFAVLCLGRFLSGVATSFLSTCFEAWMIAEHNRQAFPSAWLTKTFSTYGLLMGLVGVVSGPVAGYAEGQGGLLAPFDVCALASVVLFLLLPLLWREENYGDQGDGGGNEKALLLPLSSVAENSHNTLGRKINEVRAVFFSGQYEVVWVGLTQACFEAALFTWVFLWTPVLDNGDIPNLNLGLAFATLMVGVMCGSSSFRILTGPLVNVSPERVLMGALVAGTAALLFSSLPVAAPWLLLAFVVYEACVGVYFASMGSIRARVIPEAMRATVMAVARVLLNLLIVLMYVGPIRVDLPMEEKKPLVLGLCAALVWLASVCHAQVMGSGTSGGGGGGGGNEGAEEEEEAMGVIKAQ